MKLSSFLLLMHCHLMANGQISGMWHSSQYAVPFTDYGMSLEGAVKTWIMTKPNGDSRTMTFDKSGKVISDTFTGTRQSFIPPEFKVFKLKKDLEKPHAKSKGPDSSCIYNDKMQLIERRGANYFEKNTFDGFGRVLMHQQSSITTETRAWNSIHHAEPTYTYTVQHGVLAFFRYNQHGNLVEVSYFNANSEHNLKMVYRYDENQNMVETNRYDSYNIGVHNRPDDYLDTLQKLAMDTSFSIEAFYPDYWGVGEPAVNKWKYNVSGQKVEYNAYGYKPNGGAAVISFIGKWEYDEQGRRKKEIHYDVWKDRVSRIIEFDRIGNVIRETQIGYDGREDQVSEMRIEYY